MKMDCLKMGWIIYDTLYQSALLQRINQNISTRKDLAICGKQQLLFHTSHDITSTTLVPSYKPHHLTQNDHIRNIHILY
jgi:hypothetical protein